MTTDSPGAPRPKLHIHDIIDKISNIRADVRKLIAYNRRTKTDSGSQSITPSAANVVTSISVNFNKTFENVPQVACQFTTGISGTATCFVWPTAVTTSGFTLNINRSTTTTTGVNWIASDSIAL